MAALKRGKKAEDFLIQAKGQTLIQFHGLGDENETEAGTHARFAEVYAAAEPMRVAPNSFVPAAASGSACPIKGNVNRKGKRIYHVPGGRDYDRVAMENCDASGACAHGKRWFCSAAEAEAAGWRQPH